MFVQTQKGLQDVKPSFTPTTVSLNPIFGDYKWYVLLSTQTPLIEDTGSIDSSPPSSPIDLEVSQSATVEPAYNGHPRAIIRWLLYWGDLRH